MRPLPIAVQRMWHVIAIAAGVIALIVLGAADLTVRTQLDPPFPPIVLPLLLAGAIGGLGVVGATLRFRSWRFELTDEWIQARWGVVTHRCATIPRNRVQTMTSENGPIDRLLGLTSVTVHTAGAGAPNLSIPHLDDHTVEWLRNELARGSGR